MYRYNGGLKNNLVRIALSAAAFAMSATLFIAVLSAFYGISRGQVLADTPQALSSIAACDKHGARIERRKCAQRLIASAKARDAGEAQLAASAARQRIAGW